MNTSQSSIHRTMDKRSACPVWLSAPPCQTRACNGRISQPSNSGNTDHPSAYQSMLISLTSHLLQGVSNEKQRRVNLALTEKRGIAAIRELCRTRHAARQAFSIQLTQRRQEAKTQRAGRWRGGAGGEELTQRRRDSLRNAEKGEGRGSSPLRSSAPSASLR